MSNLLQVCLYNTEPESSDELHGALNPLNYIRLMAEVGTPEDLAATLADGTVGLIFFHLDPNPSEVLEIIDQVSQRYPEVAMIALSHQTDPEAILAPIRAGCDQFVCEPIDRGDLASAVQRVSSKRLLGRGAGRTVGVVGASGGVGATSIAGNLALEIVHLAKKPCALVDLDLQFGDAAVNFDCDPEYTFHDAATAGTSLDRAVLERILEELPCDVAVLARPHSVNQIEEITSDVVHHVIELLTSMYENVVVDLPRRLDACTFAALSQADIVLVVCQLLVPSIRNAARYLDALVELGIPEERIEVVVNRADSNSGRITVKDLEELIKKPTFACIPNDYQFVSRALDFGRPIAGVDHNNPVRREIRKMAAKLSGGTYADKSGGSGRRGLLGRLGLI